MTAGFLEPLDRIPFVRGVVVDGDIVTITLPCGQVRYKLLAIRGAARSTTPSVLAHPPQNADRWLVCADHIGSAGAETLRASGVEFLDRAGNLLLNPDDRYMAWVEGKRTVRSPRARGLRGASYRVLFAALADQFLLNWPPQGRLDLRAYPSGPPLRERPLRYVAERAGVSTSAVTNLWNHLERTGALLRTSAGLVLADPDAAAETWLVGYRDLVRPRLILGRLRLPSGGPIALERTLDACRGDGGWCWGAHAAAGLTLGDPDAMARGPNWTVHVGDIDRLDELPLDADPNGTVIVLGVPGPLAFAGKISGHPIAHPLLFWSELRIADEPRSREIADSLAETWRWTWSPRS